MSGQALSPLVISKAQAALGADLDLSEDPQISPAMRIHLARVLLGRLLGQLGERLVCDGVHA